VLPVPFQNPWLASLYAALYSWGLSAFAIISTAVGIGWTLGPTNGGFNDWPTFVTFAGHAWFGCVIGLVFQIGPYARARQGFTAAKGENTPPPEQNQPAPIPTS
jgi:hypothetical protein